MDDYLLYAVEAQAVEDMAVLHEQAAKLHNRAGIRRADARDEEEGRANWSRLWTVGRLFSPAAHGSIHLPEVHPRKSAASPYRSSGVASSSALCVTRRGTRDGWSSLEDEANGLPSGATAPRR